LIEGVRLVTGEEALVGIPVRRVISKGLLMPEAAVVLAVQSGENKFSLASAPIAPGQHTTVSTTVYTQIRNARGNLRKQFSDQGLLVFDNTAEKISIDTQRLLATEAGISSWVMGVRAHANAGIPVVCGDETLPEGVVAIECLSSNAWGIADVIIEEFKGQTGVYANAVKAVLREALNRMQTPPSFGLLFFNFSLDEIPKTDLDALFEAAAPVVGDVPLIGLVTDHVLLRNSERALNIKNQSITILLGSQ